MERDDRQVPRIEAIESALETYRSVGGDTAERSVRFRRRLALGCIVGGGISIGGGSLSPSTVGLTAVGIGVGLLVCSAVIMFSERRLVTKIEQRQSARRAVLESARDAGLTVEKMIEIPPLIREFRESHRQ